MDVVRGELHNSSLNPEEENMDVTLTAIDDHDKTAFRQMALDHFVEINPTFVPDAAWEGHFVESCLTSESVYARWIVADGQRAGFVVYPHPTINHRLASIVHGYSYFA